LIALWRAALRLLDQRVLVLAVADDQRPLAVALADDEVKPSTVGSMVTNEIVPSSFLREATALYHVPKSKIVAPSCLRTVSVPSAGEA
jgi:hypothetical protein